MEPKNDGLVKSRHSREACPRMIKAGSGNPEERSYMKRLDSRLHGNDRNMFF